MKILQSEEPDAEDAGHALRKLALVGTSAIPLDLLTPEEGCPAGSWSVGK